eukprot:6954179-Pyramimonas_sp.AAC.1
MRAGRKLADSRQAVAGERAGAAPRSRPRRHAGATPAKELRGRRSCPGAHKRSSFQGAWGRCS